MKQSDFGEKTGVEHGMFAQYELDKAEPGDDYLERAARTADLTVAAGDHQVLRLADALRRPRQRAGQGAEDLFGERLAALASSVYERLLRLSLPGSTPRAEDRQRADELWALLENLPEDQQSALVRVARELQSWVLVERICEESVVQASRDVGRAAALARLAREIAQRVRGPEGWPKRILGFAEAHAANVQRVAGELKPAAAAFEEAKRLWHAGSDPHSLLDPGRLLSLEGALLRGQRRFDDALARLDEAVAVGRSPELALIQKGFTLEVMGEYERAIETLLQAESRPDVQADPRLRNILCCNLGFVFCHAGRFAEAAELARQARAVAAEMGDEIGVLRVTWLEGRIAAGLGRPAAALRLFHEAAEREAATGELARRVLRYLFRAQHDPELRFER
jgi:tetratricopeptide (TPR) repeat protein